MQLIGLGAIIHLNLVMVNQFESLTADERL